MQIKPCPRHELMTGSDYTVHKMSAHNSIPRQHSRKLQQCAVCTPNNSPKL